MTVDTTDILKKFAISPPKEYQIFDNATLKIKSNIFQCKDTTIQISNIARVFVKGLPREKYPFWYIALVLVGFVVLTVPSFDDVSFLGLLCIIIGGLLIFRIYQYNKATQNGLQIEMNSGGISFLISTDLSFLEKASQAISDTIDEFGKKGSVNNFYEMDFANAQIKGVVTIGSQSGEIHNEQV